MWYGLNCVPNKEEMLEVLTPSPCVCDLICKQSLYRGNQVKIRSLRWAAIQYDWCPYRKVKFGDGYIQRKHHVKNRVRLPRVKNHQKQGERPQKRLPSQPSEGINSANALIQTFRQYISTV